MKIGCLQFAPQVGDVDNNLNRADAVLSRANPQDLDLLVLPELAFSGYNFKSLQHISPYLEHTASGITSLWARTTALKYECAVTVGYPEKVDISSKWPASPEYYNSAITVNADGETIANYRKTFLYYCDETWALEGPDGFYDGVILGLGNVAMGICKWPTTDSKCMDLNPYKFEAPWTAWEFAYHVLHKQANLVIISMAWLTRQDLGVYSRKSKEPDIDTLSYWVARLEPIIRAEDEGEIIVVLANRCGSEDEAIYAGTSCVLGIEDGEVKVYGILGRGERELLVVDTTNPPQFKLVAEPNTVVAEDTLQSRNAPAILDPDKAVAEDSRAPDTPYPHDGQGPLTSIDAVLAEITGVSPVEPTSPHAFFGRERPHSEELLRKVRSSIPASESQSPTTSISSSVAIASPVPLLKDPSLPRAGTPRAGRSTQAMPADRTSDRQLVPEQKSKQKAKQRPEEILRITTEHEWNIEHRDQPPDSASSMRVNTTWESSPSLFRAEEIIQIMRSPSPPLASTMRHASPPVPPPVPKKPRSSSQASIPVIPISSISRQGSPLVVPIMSKSSAVPIESSSRHALPPFASSFVPPTDRPQSPKSRNTSRSRTQRKEPALASQDLINEPALAPIIAPVEGIATGVSHHPTADPSTQSTPQGGLAPRNERSMSPRPRSTSW